MFNIEERELNAIVQVEYRRGLEYGIKLMEHKLLTACENRNPIEIGGKAYFVKSDIENLRDVFADLEREGEI